MYLARLDITYAVNKLCQFSYSPPQTHHDGAYKEGHYVKGTIDLGLLYYVDCHLVIKGFNDAGWASWVYIHVVPHQDIVCFLENH